MSVPSPAGPVLLDRSAHRRLRLNPARVQDQSGARHMNAVFCAAAEFAEACKAFPLLFIRSSPPDPSDGGQGVITPVCLLGLQNGQNLFVGDDDGRWLADYLPAFLRRHPFSLVKAGEDEEATEAVAVDLRHPALAEDGDGESLFGADGQPTPHLQGVMQFLNDFERAAEQTQPIGAHLQSLGLLKSMRAQGPLPGGNSFSVDGFLVVDEVRLRELPDAAVLALHRNGLLALIHAHLVSLSNLHKLVERRSAQLASPAA